MAVNVKTKLGDITTKQGDPLKVEDCRTQSTESESVDLEPHLSPGRDSTQMVTQMI